MLDKFQDIDELYKIVTFQTGDTIDVMAEKLGYSRPHLSLLLKGKGSKAVISDLVDKIKKVW